MSTQLRYYTELCFEMGMAASEAPVIQNPIQKYTKTHITQLCSYLTIPA